MNHQNPTPDAAAQSPPASPSQTPDPQPTEPLSLDLSDLPPLITPRSPSNTLLITNLNSPSTFHPVTLQTIKSLLSTPHPLNSFSPLPSFHRIIVSYPTTAAAIHMRQVLDTIPLIPTSSNTSTQNNIDDDRPRIYFGYPTPLLSDLPKDQHLKAPSLGKVLFISPPPSPPCGWEIREEEPPNKEIIAADLAKALAGLSGSGLSGSDLSGSGETGNGNNGEEKYSPMSEEERGELGLVGDGRGRRGSLVYHPGLHGVKEDLPAVMVVDTEEGVGEEGAEGRGLEMTKTARPPVELMEGV
ncbi:hypothetical protein JMJ35_003574 [Cladonia borealis]|uniref:Calcipressin n=1 Tax=Cladonia borealis TaxID=184061 RepID=A0AA39V2Y8_9LECA|nr:hypothetical protein JMJ35_003574 [Cladonia borealis]